MATQDKDIDLKASSLTVIEKVEEISSNSVLASNAMSEEDEFSDLYYTVKNGEGAIIQPPYDQKRLMRLVVENNTLSQCVTAYEVNIDVTGYTIESDDNTSESNEENVEIGHLEDFFKESYIGESFTSQRRKVRRDIEGSGNGYMEVIRNAADAIVFTKHVATQTMRICRLGNPIPVKKKVTRAGKEVEVTVLVRERAYAQSISGKLVYFKEFGSTRDINRNTGEWSQHGSRLPADKRGTEIIHFTAIKDVDSPYGVPRWINQVPSVLGSRKAEELNLDFFEFGGIPPLLMMIQGGQMAEDSKKELNKIMNKGVKESLRAAILEIHSTSGSIDGNSSAKVDVEKFGSEQKSDSMYENYDDRCEKRVRSSFRLPPMFLGKAEDYSYATAFASYTVAETQVFNPERKEFDEVINNTLLKGMGVVGLTYRSLPLSVNDATMQLMGLDKVADKISPEDLIEAVNEIVNLNLKFDKQTATDAKAREEEDRVNVLEGRNIDNDIKQGNTEPAPEGESTPVQGATPNKGGTIPVAKADTMELLDLANDWVRLLSDENPNTSLLRATTERINTLSKEDRSNIDRMIATKMYTNPDRDFDGAADICGVTLDILSKDKESA
ncbi:MAG: hypothetical protein GQ570_03820 [Helicobacteraceae bacterium]|nr:hypothetical protein [Helicobacteraceae bacterium]